MRNDLQASPRGWSHFDVCFSVEVGQVYLVDIGDAIHEGVR